MITRHCAEKTIKHDIGMPLRHDAEMTMICFTPLFMMVGFHRWAGNHLAEFCIITLPQYLCIAHPPLAAPVFFAAVAAALWSMRGRLAYHKREACAAAFTSTFRTNIMIPVVICIFLCDFDSIWTPRLGKGIGYGAGLMDFGLVAFIVNAGFFTTRVRLARRAQSVLILGALGFTRLAVIRMCRLEVNPVEYGLHLNFFFILGAISLLFLALPTRRYAHAGCGLLALHFVLVEFMRERIFSAERSGFMQQNKEGLFMIAPLFALYLIYAAMGQAYFAGHVTHERFVWFVFEHALRAGVWYSAVLPVEPPSRQLLNASFVAWALYLSLLFFGVIAWLVSRAGDAFSRYLFVRFGGRHMLALFLWSNLLVLGYKMVDDGAGKGAAEAHAHNLVYLALSNVLLPAFHGMVAGK